MGDNFQYHYNLPFYTQIDFPVNGKNYPLPLLPRIDILHIQNFTI